MAHSAATTPIIKNRTITRRLSGLLIGRASGGRCGDDSLQAVCNA
jgi:hypothetical protein